MSVEKLATVSCIFWISVKFNSFIHEETEKNVFVKLKGAEFQFMKQKGPKKSSCYNSVFDLFKTQKF